jgi:hypothetical protein
MITVAIAGSAASIVISPVASATAPAAPLETSWGVADLQGYWDQRNRHALRRKMRPFNPSARRCSDLGCPGEEIDAERSDETLDS